MNHYPTSSEPLPSRRSLRHLKRLSPVDRAQIDHVTRELPSNGAGVDYVRHHALTFIEPEAAWQVVEKSLRKPLLYRSREARFYRHYAMLDACRKIAYPALLDVVETPRRSAIYSAYIEGKRPVRAKLLHDAAGGIAELEAVSARYIASGVPGGALDFWLMDFFRWPYLRHTRLNFQRFLGNLRLAGLPEATRARLASRLGTLAPWLKLQLRQARRTPRCICHLDYAAKNMLVDGDRLYLLDWSEVKVGRIGFDGADFLAKLFSHLPLKRFEVLRQRFERDYDLALAQAFTQGSLRPVAGQRDDHAFVDTDDPSDLTACAAHNRRTLFMLLSLWRSLQVRTVRLHLEAGTVDEWVAKLDYLLAESNRQATAPADEQTPEMALATPPTVATSLSE